MKKHKSLEELMRECESNDDSDMKINLQIIKDGEIVDEMEGNGIVGVIFDECDKCDNKHNDYAFTTGGGFTIQDLVLAKYTFEKGTERMIEIKSNPLADMMNDMLNL